MTLRGVVAASQLCLQCSLKALCHILLHDPLGLHSFVVQAAWEAVLKAIVLHAHPLFSHLYEGTTVLFALSMLCACLLFANAFG